MKNSILQRSDEWHEQRKGKFTASEIYKLMGIKALGETGKGYAFDKAMRSKVAQRILAETPEETKIFARLYADIVVRVNQLLKAKVKKEFTESNFEAAFKANATIEQIEKSYTITDEIKTKYLQYGK